MEWKGDWLEDSPPNGAYGKAFYHSVTKNLKINTKSFLNRNGEKIHNHTGKAIMSKSPSMVRFETWRLLISNQRFRKNMH